MNLYELVHGHLRLYWDMFLIHEAYRRLGFPSENLCAVFGRDITPTNACVGEVCAHMSVRDGNRTHTFHIGPKPPKMDDNDFVAGWRRFAEAIVNRDITDDRMETYYNENIGRIGTAEFVDSICAKGLRPPVFDKIKPFAKA